jgi:hypothetical protein
MDLRAILEAGHAAQAAAKAEVEKDKRGTLRVGSVGAVCTDNQIRGVCHRVALLRKLGVEEEAGLGTRIMWAAGEVSEISMERVLTAAGHTVDMQYPVTLEVTPEIKVSGHPDVIVDGKFGLELKGVFGYSTAALVYLDHKPKNENLIQAATYSMAAGLPWALVYTSPSYWSVPFYDKKKTELKSLPPFYAVFYLEWRDQELWYRHEDETEWVKTLVTKQGIKDFYVLVSEMDTAKELGPRVVDSYLNGDPSKWNDPCKFCPWSSACDKYDMDKDFDTWLQTCADKAQ